MKYLKIIYTDCWFTFLVLLFKKKKKGSENDQSTGHFQSFIIPDPKSDFSSKSANKLILALSPIVNYNLAYNIEHSL